MAEEVTLESLAGALVKLNEAVGEIQSKVQSDIEGVKSGFQSNFDKLRGDVDALATKSPSTEAGKTAAQIGERRDAEKQQEALKDAVGARDSYWQAFNEAVYEKQLPKTMFEGVTSAAEIKRMTALADWLKPSDKTKTTTTTGNAGAEGTPAQTVAKGIAAVQSALKPIPGME